MQCALKSQEKEVPQLQRPVTLQADVKVSQQEPKMPTGEHTGVSSMHSPVRGAQAAVSPLKVPFM